MHSWFCGKKLLLAAALAGFLNLLPSLLVYPAGDLLHTYALIQCYGEQIWQGHFYPRWCMGANAGYGSSAPIFYFPMPFYISSIFYPLRYFGMEITGVYMVVLWFAHAVTFYTATSWLKTITTPTKAAVCAFILLWCSYRMEVAASRSSLAELWCLAFMPLLFMKLRQMAANPAKCWPPLALIIMVIMLCHAPVAMLGLMAAGIYLLIAASQKIKSILLLGVATALGFAATYFHWAAATIMTPTLNSGTGGINFWKNSWLNNYVDSPILKELVPSLLFLGMNAAIIIFLLIYLHKKNMLLRRETTAWAAIIIFSGIMMFGFSQPLWELIEQVSKVKTPWRMQALVMFGMVYFMAVASNFVTKPKLWALLAVVLFAGTGSRLVQTVENQDLTVRAIFIYSQNIFGYFNTKWTSDKYTSTNAKPFLKDFVLDRPKDKATFLTGTGAAEVKQWNYDGIIIKTHSEQDANLRVEHLYFPAWQASVNGAYADISPETASLGRMMIPVPAGDNEVRITYHILPLMPPYYLWICILSFASFLIILIALFWQMSPTERRAEP